MSVMAQFSLTGRIALVTGASSGIGYTVAKGLAEAGASVVVAARRVERLESLVREIEDKGGKALAVTMDVTDKASIEAAFNQAEVALGTVDVIINNAGVADPKHFLKIDDDSLDFVMDTNFKGVWHVAQEASRRLLAAQLPGSIINIASVLGLAAHPGQTSYCSSKAAVIQLTKSLSLDLVRHNIRVNAIAPGWFKTEINSDYFDSPAGQAYIEQMPAQRLGQLEELLGPIILLASEAGSFVNGTVLPVDGAHLARMV
ncbi:glucose 1-dehydrogenase [Parahaliea sp. F7430]|uniref:Glucose 1-dehydrogenase n=1 Tax=Sediminihaliea albiluteola TaxID=2758564 RepID=A0A7W2TXF6_9GAMM|nr:glucose 1-dehydrogenase [Sediminihaliea albiluteola]MBA6413723.1 glucose 1-dehydrogenase [Sediminihaliea albiluteola]